MGGSNRNEEYERHWLEQLKFELNTVKNHKAIYITSVQLPIGLMSNLNSSMLFSRADQIQLQNLPYVSTLFASEVPPRVYQTRNRIKISAA